MISAPTVNQMRCLSSVAFDRTPRLRLAASCSAADAMCGSSRGSAYCGALSRRGEYPDWAANSTSGGTARTVLKRAMVCNVGAVRETARQVHRGARGARGVKEFSASRAAPITFLRELRALRGGPSFPSVRRRNPIIRPEKPDQAATSATATATVVVTEPPACSTAAFAAADRSEEHRVG